MVIGSSELDYNKLKKFVGRPDDLVAYVENMVPLWARHISCLSHNQRFYVAVHLRKMISIPYKQRNELVEALVEGIHIHGMITGFVQISDIVRMCDKDSLVEMLKLEVTKSE